MCVRAARQPLARQPLGARAAAGGGVLALLLAAETLGLTQTHLEGTLRLSFLLSEQLGLRRRAEPLALLRRPRELRRVGRRRQLELAALGRRARTPSGRHLYSRAPFGWASVIGPSEAARGRSQEDWPS